MNDAVRPDPDSGWCTTHFIVHSHRILVTIPMNTWVFIGLTAACLTMFGFLPQIVRMYTTRSVHDVSVITLIQFTAGVSLWAFYGWYIGDRVVIGANIVTLAPLLVVLGLWFQNRQPARPFTGTDQR